MSKLLVASIHQFVFQMKLEHKAIISKAMYFLITNLDVDVSLLSEIESQKLLDAQSIQEILVGFTRFLQVTHTCIN